MRKRKTEESIAEKLQISLTEATEGIKRVKEVLIGSGQIDLVNSPVMVPLHFKTPEGEEIEIPLPASEHDPVNNIILRDFISLLKESLAELPKDSARILMLKYVNRMTADEILEFCQKGGIRLIHEKTGELKVQDIYSSINKAVTILLKTINEKLKGKEEFVIDIKGLKEILEDFRFE